MNDSDDSRNEASNDDDEENSIPSLESSEENGLNFISMFNDEKLCFFDCSQSEYFPMMIAAVRDFYFGYYLTVWMKLKKTVSSLALFTSDQYGVELSETNKSNLLFAAKSVNFMV